VTLWCNTTGTAREIGCGVGVSGASGAGLMPQLPVPGISIRKGRDGGTSPGTAGQRRHGLARPRDPAADCGLSTAGREELPKLLR
jgi:hypothetical protein